MGEGGDDFFKLGGVVFEVSVLDDDVGECCALEAGAEGGSFSLVMGVGDEVDAVFFCFP